MPPLTDKQREVYDLIKKHEPIQPHEAAKKAGLTESAPLYGGIKVLLKKGFIQKTGKGKGTRYSTTNKTIT